MLSFHQRTVLSANAANAANAPNAPKPTMHPEHRPEGTQGAGAPRTQPLPPIALPHGAVFTTSPGRLEAASSTDDPYLDDAVATIPPAALTPATPTTPAASWKIARSLPTFWVGLGLALGLLAGALLGSGSYRHYFAKDAPPPDPLWSPFLSDAHATLVIYSNPLFRGSPARGLHLVDPDRPSGAGDALDNGLNDATPDNALDETYTGTGEVQAIHTLTHFFDAHNATFTLKRSRLVTWDQARSSNLIFVGAPSQNTALHDLPARSEFTIAQDAQARGYIVNQHPRPGEPAVFPTNDRTQETAIVALLPGMETGTGILVISGLTTIGTQMAVEFLCRPENLRALAEIVGTTSSGTLRSFEAVLHVSISKGVGVRVQLATVHRRG